MSSTFTGLYSATTGLNVSQAAMAVTSNNISNANTDGYSRKTLTQVSVGPAAVYISSSSTGSGAEVTAISRARNELLDQQYWAENSLATAWETKASFMSELEDVLEDVSGEDGFESIMDDFYTALEDLATDPSGTEARTCLQQAGVAVCDYLNSMASTLSQLRNELNEEVKTTVEEINSYSKQIAALNTQIQKGAVAGSDTSDLEDQRDLLIDELSVLADIDVSETTVATSTTGEGVSTVVISIDGGTLVNGGNYRTMECSEITDGTDQNGMYEVVWSDTQSSVAPESGQLGALLELRDGTGENGGYKGVLYYMEQLDEYAQTLAEAFNEGTSSYSGHVDGSSADGTTGICFFTYDSVTSDTLESNADGYDAITGANISLSYEVLEDVANIAVSSSSDVEETENSEVLAGLIDLCESDEVFGNCSLNDYLESLTATIGTASSYASSQSERHDTILGAINTRRASVSSVSTNEETTNLVLYQEAYAASAKAVSMWEELYQVMLNMVK